MKVTAIRFSPTSLSDRCESYRLYKREEFPSLASGPEGKGGLRGISGSKVFSKPIRQVKSDFDGAVVFYKMRAKYLACKGGDESPRAEGTKNMRNMSK